LIANLQVQLVLQFYL